MNILFLADGSISGCHGGSERVLYEEAVGLAARGHGVRVLTRRLERHAADEEKIVGVREYRYRVNAANAVAFFRSTMAQARALFCRLLDEEPVDLLHVHQPFTGYAVLGASRRGNTPALYTCHSPAHEEYLTRAPHPNRALCALHAAGRKWLERRTLERCAAVTTLSDFMRRRVEQHHQVPSGRIRVIPGGADHERFHPAADKRTVRSALGLPEAGVIFFTVRNLVPRMGIDALIRAMGRIAGEISHARLVIGGEGPMRPSLEALVDALGLRKRIRFVGFIPEAELPLYYQAADFFILPTAQLEGFGLVTVEALASGLPVLGTRVGGTPEILEPLDPTWLFDTPEPAAMAERIVTIVREFSPTSARYGILAIRCRRRVEEHYTWTRHLDQLERLYAQLRRR